MAKLSAASTGAIDRFPDVRIEVRSAASRATCWDMNAEEFLIGSVPGCDYRLPGTNLPPVVCIISRQSDGVRLRKVAPTLPILLNGQPIAGSGLADLTHGDTVSIGPIDLLLSIRQPEGGYAAPVPRSSRHASDDDEDRRRQEEYVRRTRETEEAAQRIEDRTRKLVEREEELEGDRVLWYRRRDEIEREMTQARDALRHARELETDLQKRQSDLAAREAALGLQSHDVAARTLDAARRDGDEAQRLQLLEQSEDRLEIRRRELEAEYRRRRQELETTADLPAIRAAIEREIAGKLRERSVELDRIRGELAEAGLQLRDRRDAFEIEVRELEPRSQDLDRRETAADRRGVEVERLRETTLIDRGAFEEKQRRLVDELVAREAALAERIVGHRDAAVALREDLLRLDRHKADLEARELAAVERAREVDLRVDRIGADTGEFEAQAREIDAEQEANRVEAVRLETLARELHARETNVLERTTQVETQQSVLTALRMNLETRREETRLEAESVAAERARVDTIASAAQDRLREAEMLRLDWTARSGGHDETRQALDDRAGLIAEAVTRMRDLQAELATEDARLQAERLAGSERETALLALSAELSEREILARTRSERLVEMESKLEADRSALRDRETALTDIDESRNSLQESLRKRSEELALRQRDLDTRHEEFAALVGGHEIAVVELERQRAELAALRDGHESREARWLLREGEYRSRIEALEAVRLGIEADRAAFESDRTRFAADIESRTREANGGEVLHRQRLAELESERDSTRKHVAELAAGLPELELRTRSILDRLGQSRDQLRGQLSELHTYARQSQEELEIVRTSIASESERLRMQETSLSRARAEHRLSVASFRQQLIEWQGRFVDMKSALTTGEARLERKESAVEETAKKVALQAESISIQQRMVTEKRSDIERHLGDMREWYRKKLRDLVETRTVDADALAGSLPIPPATSDAPATPELDEGDRRLGDLLLKLELVDRETADGLWKESQRQRRPLRQILLSGGYLTLYQLALIEAGNIHRLVLGRFRVIDRLSSSARETVFRAFDPQTIPSSGEWIAANSGPGTRLLRHLGEGEMSDPIRPDEYRQRFAAVRDVAHPNIAPTLEILEINGRPAIVQEWLSGLPGGDWPTQTSSPWVWYRLLSQTAMGLHTAHQAKLYHGRLSTSSLLLSATGSVRILGLGEPPWLFGGIEGSIEGDLRDLGQIALFWTNNGRKRGARTKFPEPLANVLRGLGASPTEETHDTAMYPNVAALLEDLDGLNAQMVPDSAAWDKLLAVVRDSVGNNPGLRLAA